VKLDTLPLYNEADGKEERACIDCGEWTKCGVTKYNKFVPLCLTCSGHRDQISQDKKMRKC